MHLNEALIQKFKKEIGFNELKNKRSTNTGVVVEWPSPDTCPILSNKGWNIESDDVEPLNEGIEGEWILKKGDETILLRIFVSCTGIEHAHQRLIEIASATTMMTIPFKKCLRPIGTLSVYISAAENQTYIWIFNNVCFYVRGIDTGADIEAFANWIQSFAQKGAVEDLNSQKPQIDSIHVNPQSIYVNDIFSVRVDLAEVNQEKTIHYLYDFNFDEQILELTDDDLNKATFKAMISGDTNISVHVADRKTLLSDFQTIVVKIESR